MDVEILRKAIEKFGIESQRLMAIEEMSELTKELCKNSRRFNNGSAISEEIADVEIMLAQLKLIFNNDDEVETFKAEKMSKLQWLVENHLKIQMRNL